MGAEYFLGVDIGTSGTRAVLFDTCGFEKASAFFEYSIRFSAGGKAEIDAEEVFAAVLGAIRECTSQVDGGRIHGVGSSSQMHSIMALDGWGNPITPLLTWIDSRAADVSSRLTERYNIVDLYQRTGARLQHPMYALGKLLWVKQHEPGLFESAAKWVAIKDFVLMRLTGTLACDVTVASSQALLNIHSRRWDDLILDEVIGLSADCLPEPVPCMQVIGGLLPEYASLTGLRSNTPFIAGSGDGPLANLGCGVVSSASLSSTVGTSGAIRALLDAPRLDPAQSTWCSCFTEGKWILGGSISYAGIVLRWLRDQGGDALAKEADNKGMTVYRLFDTWADEISAGSEGLTFLPYLTAERSPDWNASTRGLMSGLSITHDKRHIVRAAMEGIMYRLYSVYNTMSALTPDTQEIRATGGYTHSDTWLRIQADLFGKEITVPLCEEASSLGAAFLSMASLGAVPGIDERLPGVADKRRLLPDYATHLAYQESFSRAMDLYGKVHGDSIVSSR